MKPSKREPVTQVGVNRALMAVGAHADDIEFNVGGTLLKYHDAGYEIDYVMSTNNMSGTWKVREADGTLRREAPPWDAMMAKRREEAAAAAALVDTEPVHLDHPQCHFTNAVGEKVELRYGAEVPGDAGEDTPTILTAHGDLDSVRVMADIIVERNPEAVMVHGMVSNNLEHIASCLLVTNAYRRAAESGYQGMLLHWHEPGVGDFGSAYQCWDTYIDVSDYWQRKIEWIGVHASMVPSPAEADYFSPDIVRGCAQAEAFNVIDRGRRYFHHNPFAAELRMNWMR